MTLSTPRIFTGFRSFLDSERRILGLVHRRGTLSQAEITREMHLAQPTVSRLIAGLIADGALRTGPAVANGRGQPSATLSLSPDFAFGVGIAMMGDSLTLDLVDFAGVRRWSRTLRMADMKQASVLPALRSLRDRMLADTGVAVARIHAAGVGVSAFFVGEGALMNPPALLDDWALVDIAAILGDELGFDVRVDNDGNVGCLGEALRGAGRRFRSFAYFQITNGFGGGVVLDGQPYRGSYGNAGEFAALWQAAGIVHPNLDHLRGILAARGRSFANVSDMIEGFDLAWDGVDVWLDTAAPAFSLAATAAAAVIDCEAVVLGGRIPRGLATALAGRIEIAGTDRRARPRPVPLILPSEVDGDAVSLGAAMFALQPAFFI